MADLARDMFLFAFYTFGMCFKSVATFKREYIRGDIIKYTTNKGHDRMEILIHPKLAAIITKYISANMLIHYIYFPVVKEVHTP